MADIRKSTVQAVAVSETDCYKRLYIIYYIRSTNVLVTSDWSIKTKLASLYSLQKYGCGKSTQEKTYQFRNTPCVWTVVH